MMKREYQVINQPLALRHRVAQPGAGFFVDEIIGGDEELQTLISEKRVEMVVFTIPGDQKSEGNSEKVAELESVIERIDGELADALVKVEGQKAEIEELTALLDKKGVKALKDENDELKKEVEALRDKVEELEASVIDLDADGVK